MAEVQKIRLGTREDGTALYHLHAPEGHAVFVGPIRGSVDTSKGTVYVDDDVVIVDSKAHADEVAFAVGERYAAEGHPSHDAGNPFIHDHPKAKKGSR